MSPPSSRKEKEAEDANRAVSGSVQSDKQKAEGDSKSDAAVEDADKPKEPVLTPSQQAYKRLVDCIHTLERAVITKESRLHLRVIRTTFQPSVRKQLSKPLVQALVTDFYPELQVWLDQSKPGKPAPPAPNSTSSSSAAASKKKDDSSMDVEHKEETKEADDDETELLLLKRVFSTPVQQRLAEDKSADEAKQRELFSSTAVLSAEGSVDTKPEVRTFIHLITLVYLLDTRTNDQLAAECSRSLVDYISSFNRRSLDWLSSKVWYMYDLVYGRIDQLESIRPTLLNAHRTATLQHNEPGVAALTVSLLRNYLHYNLYAAADTFRLKSTFPEQRSNNLLARYLYYVGRIEAIQLHYSAAYNSISQALRKGPQKKNVAVGFRLRATKLYVIVQLLMGDIPDKTLFAASDLQHALIPYYELTKAVRVGDLEQFNAVIAKFRDDFEQDQLISFVIRLRNNVIKAGLRKISLAYSRISLKDMASKLGLESVEDCEYVVVKAISDGVIDARVDHSTGVVTSKETLDIYSTNEPQQQFHKRIEFCLSLHNEAVKSMRYPQNLTKLLALTDAGFDAEEDDDDENASTRAAAAAAEKKESEGPKKK